jgi:polar amino acid transport system substrate-binding protein
MRRRVLAPLLFAVALAAMAGCSDARDHARQVFVPRTEGVLVVATALPAPGFWEGDDPATVDGGYEWDLASRLAERLGLELEIIDVPFARLVAGDLDGADLAMAQISVTSARAEVVDFSQSYYTTDAGVLAPAGGTIPDLKTARESTWVVVDGSTEADLVASDIRPAAELVVVADETEAAAALLAGRADAALVDLPTALVLAQDDDRLSVIARVVTADRYAVAMPSTGPDRARNRQVVDAALRAFRSDGTLADLADRWLAPRFAADPADIPVIRIR